MFSAADIKTFQWTVIQIPIFFFHLVCFIIITLCNYELLKYFFVQSSNDLLTFLFVMFERKAILVQSTNQ